MSVSACLNFPFGAGSGLFIFNSLNVSSFLIISSVHVSTPHASHSHDSASMSFGPECICISLSRLTQEYCPVFFSRNNLLHSCPKFLLLVFILPHRPFQWSTSCSVSSDTGLSSCCCFRCHMLWLRPRCPWQIKASYPQWRLSRPFFAFISSYSSLATFCSSPVTILVMGFRPFSLAVDKYVALVLGGLKAAGRDRQRHFPLEPKYVRSNAPRSAISNTLRQSPCCWWIWSANKICQVSCRELPTRLHVLHLLLQPSLLYIHFEQRSARWISRTMIWAELADLKCDLLHYHHKRRPLSKDIAIFHLILVLWFVVVNVEYTLAFWCVFPTKGLVHSDSK